MSITAIPQSDGSVDLIGYQGHSWNLSTQLYKDIAKTTPFSLDGYSVRVIAKLNNTVGASPIVMECTITDAVNGKIECAVTPAQTKKIPYGSYSYEMQLYTYQTVTRILNGLLFVKEGLL